jgi:hypothetical protein
MMSNISENFSTYGAGAIEGQVGTGTLGAAWPSANKPVAVPFWVPTPAIIYRLGWRNSAGTLNTNVDVGVYDSAWARLVSTGSTARSGSNAMQFVDVADTVVVPSKKYYLVGACDATTANNHRNWPLMVSATHMALIGVLDSATNAFPLPDPLTNMVAAATFTGLPQLFMAMRSYS